MGKRVKYMGFEGAKIPPNEIALEEAVLGALLIERDAFEKVSDILNKDCFYKDINGIVYNAIAELAKQKNPIDILTVTSWLRKAGKLETAGGEYYIVELAKHVSSGANIETHARLVVEAYLAREGIRIGGEFQQRLYENNEDVFELLDEYFKEIDAIRNYGIDSEGEVPLGVSIDERVKEKEEMVRNKIEITGITTGNKTLDSITSGHNKGNVYVYGGATGMGKSVKGLNFARIAAELGHRVPVFSLEMPKNDFIDRFLSEEARIPLHDYRSNRMTDYDIVKMRAAAQAFKKLPITIFDNPSANTNYIRKKLKSEIKKYGSIGLVVIDYAQLLKCSEKAGTREQELSIAIKEVKVIAKEFNVPIVLLAMIGRGIWQVSDRRPNLNHLRETAELENTADFVGLIYRPSYYFDYLNHPDLKDPESKISKIEKWEYDFLSELIVCKNRAGIPNCVLHEKFYGHYSCFTTEYLDSEKEPFETDNNDILPSFSDTLPF